MNIYFKYILKRKGTLIIKMYNKIKRIIKFNRILYAYIKIKYYINFKYNNFIYEYDFINKINIIYF